jgi:hypothetical protein
MTGLVGANLTGTWDATTITQGNAPAVGNIYQHYNGNVYKFVQYEAGAAAAAGVAGEVAYYYAPSGASAGSSTVVTSDLSDSAGVGAGVLQASLADGEYGWIQIKGAATLSIALTAGADGDSLTPTGAGDGTLDLAAAVETDHVCATALDASVPIIMCDFPY